MTQTMDPEPLDQHGKRTAASRMLSLLGAFSRGGGALTLSEISRHAGLSMTTTHRLTREVLEWGGLELDDTGHYRLSRKFLDLAFASAQDLQLRETALPQLMDLHRRSGLTVHLSVRVGRDVMYLEALRSHPNYTGENRLGGRLRLHVTATGLVLLAFSDQAVVEDYLSEPLKRYTPYTITDAPTLRRALEEIRRNGYAMASRFVVPGAASVAAPVIDPDGRVEAALGVTYKVDRCDPHRLADQVRMTAKRVSRALREKNPAPDRRTIDFNRRHAGLV